jgi:hypothetical protein
MTMMRMKSLSSMKMRKLKNLDIHWIGYRSSEFVGTVTGGATSIS